MSSAAAAALDDGGASISFDDGISSFIVSFGAGGSLAVAAVILLLSTAAAASSPAPDPDPDGALVPSPLLSVDPLLLVNLIIVSLLFAIRGCRPTRRPNTCAGLSLFRHSPFNQSTRALHCDMM